MPGGSCFCMHTNDIQLFGNKKKNIRLLSNVAIDWFT